MKLRIKGNSIRLRLTQSEVQTIARGHPVKEHTSFPGGSRLVYAIEPSSRVAVLTADFSDHTLAIAVPLLDAQAWANGTAVAMQARLEELAVLIEKDFTCLKERENQHEDESDMFPNPNLAHGHCT